MKKNLNNKLLPSFSLFSFLKTTYFMTLASLISLAECIYSRVALLGLFLIITCGGCYYYHYNYLYLFIPSNPKELWMSLSHCA